MKEMKVSIIIPVYNMETYLRSCLDSVLAQTYRNLQIILIDDGSGDASGKICDEYAARDIRITVIHKENGGLSSARNAGHPAVNGDFVFYLDSDDYLEPDAIMLLIQAQSSCEADMVVGSYYYTYEDHEDAAPVAYLQDTTLSSREAMEALVSGKIQNFAWGKLIRSVLVQKHLFPEGKLFEDTFWAHHVVHDCNAVCVLVKPIIHYRQRSNSISYSYTLNRLDVLEGWRARLYFLEKTYPDLVPSYLQHLVPMFLNIAWLTLTRMKTDRGLAFRKLAEFSCACNLCDFASENERKAVFLLQTNYAKYAIYAIFDRLVRGK